MLVTGRATSPGSVVGEKLCQRFERRDAGRDDSKVDLDGAPHNMFARIDVVGERAHCLNTKDLYNGNEYPESKEPK